MFKLRKYLIPWLFFSINEIAVVLGNCSPDCTSCTNDTCVTCELRTYLESGSCHPCPEHCTSCYNSEACNNCTDGYFGLSCAYNCSLWCVNNTCNKDSGVCTGGCIDGYFLSGLLCFQCSHNCKTCANYSFNCVQCKDGNYGANCETPCSRCKDGICSKENCTYGCGDGYFQENGACELCNIRCRSCSGSYDNCHTCIDGYFGKGCQFPCSDCITCNLEDGSCSGPTMNPTTASTDLTTRSIALVTSVPKTTTKASSSVSSQTNTSPEPSQILTTTESKNYQDNQSVDNAVILYASAGGGGGLAFVVLVVVVVILYKRRLRIKQTNGRNNSQIRESDGASPDYTTLTTGPREQDDHLYSSLDNTNSMVTMEPRSTTRELSGQGTRRAMHQMHMEGTEYGTYVNVN